MMLLSILRGKDNTCKRCMEGIQLTMYAPFHLQQLYQAAQANTWEARINQIVAALATPTKAGDHRL